jgi:septal ring factor EnvC (AmiA/AmiB activator)
MISRRLALNLTVLAIAATVVINPTFAKPNNFGNVKMDNTAVSTPPQSLPFDDLSTTPINAVNDNTGATSQKLQDALINIESAQVEIRKNLSVTQQKYAEVDKNFVMVKTERGLIKKQIKETKKRLNALEKTKKKIRKELNQVNNFNN